MWILITILVLAIVVLGVCLRLFMSQAPEVIELAVVANQMKAEFEEQLLALSASVYRRPTKIVPTVEQITGKWAVKRKYRILLTVHLTLETDLPIVYSMLEKFMVSYLAKPGNSRYKVRIFFQPFSNP